MGKWFSKDDSKRELEHQRSIDWEKISWMSVDRGDDSVKFCCFDLFFLLLGGTENEFIAVVPHGEREREEMFHWFWAWITGVVARVEVSVAATGVMVGEPERGHTATEESVPTQGGLLKEAAVKRS